MNIRIWSDIHLELAKNAQKLINKLLSIPVPQNTILILAGDIGNPTSKIYKNFVTEAAQKYEQVMLITGNHEYYQKYKRKKSIVGDSLIKFRYTILEIDNQIRELNIPNVHFLQQNTFEYKNIKFIGCTLWTESNPDLSHCMNDYECISEFTPEMCNSLHESDVEWLTNELNKPFDGKKIVVTHHLPSYKLIADKYLAHPLNSFFANYNDELISKCDLWICGHSHYAQDKYIEKRRCIINPLGYSLENTGWKPDLLIQI